MSFPSSVITRYPLQVCTHREYLCTMDGASRHIVMDIWLNFRQHDHGMDTHTYTQFNTYSLD